MGLVGLEAAAGGLPETLPVIGLDQTDGGEALLQALDGEGAVALDGEADEVAGVLGGHLLDFRAVLHQARHEVAFLGDLEVLSGDGEAHGVALLALEVDDDLAIEGVDVLDLAKAPGLAAHVDLRLQGQEDGEAADDGGGRGGGQADGIDHQLFFGGGGAAANDLTHLGQVDALQLNAALGKEVHAGDRPRQIPVLHGGFGRRGETLDRALRVFGQLFADHRKRRGDVRLLGVQQFLDLRPESDLIHIHILSTESNSPTAPRRHFRRRATKGTRNIKYQKGLFFATLRGRLTPPRRTENRACRPEGTNLPRPRRTERPCGAMDEASVQSVGAEENGTAKTQGGREPLRTPSVALRLRR